MVYMKIHNVLLLVLIFLTTLIGCTSPEDNGGGDELAFQSFSPASLLVTNMTGERLVAFKGTVSSATLISGIPAYADNHGLKKDTALFNSTGTFILVLITEAQYNANKNNLAVLNDQAFAKLFAFYNHSVSNPLAITISSSLGGSGCLIVNNPTSYNVVLRKDSPAGEFVGYAAPQALNNTISLAVPGDYIIYPVFIHFNPATQELITKIPTFTGGNLNGQPFMWTFSLTDNNSSSSVDVSEIAGQGNLAVTSGGAYFRTVCW